MRIGARVSLLMCVAVMLLWAGPAKADRRTSLHGDPLIIDADDVFLFPHLTLDYTNLIRFDLGTSEASGNGLLIFGNDSTAFGVAVHRGDLTVPDPYGLLTFGLLDDYEEAALGGPGSILTGGTLGVPAPTIVDLLAGFALGGDSKLGFRLALGSADDSSTTDDATGNQETTTGNFFAMADVGYGMLGNMRLDLGLSLLFATGSETVSDTDTGEGTAFRAAVSGRAFSPLSEGIDLGIIGNLGVLTRSYDNQVADTSQSELAFNALVGCGPAYRVGPATITGFAFLGFFYQDVEPNDQVDDDERSDMRLVIPGVHMAFEIDLLDWLAVRSGLSYGFGINSTDNANGSSASNSDGGFGWDAGIGMTFGDFTLDGTFEHGFVTNGPDFIGGDGPLFGMVSASYSF